MPARHFRSVDLPEPLRPTMPKNSPRWTSTETSRRACSVSVRVRRSGCSARSLSVCTRSCGSSNVFDTPRTATAGMAAFTALRVLAPEDTQVVQEIADDPRPYHRCPVLLGLHPPPDAHALVRV